MNELTNQRISVTIDETTDNCERSILNILFSYYNKIKLVNIIFLEAINKDDICNSELQINCKLRYYRHLWIFKFKVHNVRNSTIFAIPQLSAILQLSAISQLFAILIGRYL